MSGFGCRLQVTKGRLKANSCRWFSYCALLIIPVFLMNGCGSWQMQLCAEETNVVLIMIDTLRADHLGCYGYSRDTSPNIDRFASEGVVLGRTISQSPWTRPSVASILTSTYPLTHGIVKERFDGLPQGLTTLSELLHDEGYSTYGYTANPNLNAVFGFNQGFDIYINSIAVFNWMLGLKDIPDETPTGLGNFLNAAILTDLVLRDVEKFQPPFYLQVFYMDPHVPYTPPPPYNHRFGNGSEEDLYDGEIAFTDEHVGRIVDEIMKNYPNTLVVITSDHGEGFNENNNSLLDKRHGNLLYDTIVHVPLIINHPSLEARTVRNTVELIDLFPTIIELLGLECPGGVEGTSFAPALMGEEAVDKNFAYMETGWRNMNKAGIISRQWKYIMNMDHEVMNKFNRERGLEEYFLPDELYNLSTGGPERTDQNLSGQHPDIVDSLKAQLVNFMKTHAGHMEKRVIPGVDDETLKQLKALGYLGESNR